MLSRNVVDCQCSPTSRWQPPSSADKSVSREEATDEANESKSDLLNRNYINEKMSEPIVTVKHPAFPSKRGRKTSTFFVMISLNIGVVLNTTILFCSTIFVHREPQCVAAMYNVVASESQSCSGKRNIPYLRRVLPVNVFFSHEALPVANSE